MRTTFTPVVVDIEITREGTTLFDSSSGTKAIYVAEVQISNRLNNIPEAIIGIGFRNRDAHKQILSIFPQTGKGAMFAKVDITVRGFRTKRSAITEPHNIFSGYVTGYGISKSSKAGTQYTINARGGLYLLSQTPIATIGFHPASPFAWGVFKLSSMGSDNTNMAPGQLLGVVDVRDTAWQIFSRMFSRFTEVMTKSNATVNSALGNEWHTRAFRAAQEAFKLTEGQQQFLKDEIALVTELDNLVLPWEGDRAAVHAFLYRAFTDYQATFWHLIIELCQHFGVVIISVGNKVYISALTPLDTSGINYLAAEETTSIEVSDFPFSVPTRVLLTAPKYNSSVSAGQIDGDPFILYPPESKLTEQEKKTGVKTLLFQAPGVVGKLTSEIKIKAYNDIKLHKEVSRDKNKQSVQSMKDAIANLDKPKLGETYAAYVLMAKKFEQRLGTVLSRYRPDIIPGFGGVVVIGDNLNMLGYVTEVTHSLSATSQTALTQTLFSHVHYASELTNPEIIKNPLYPSFDTQASATKILTDVGFLGVVPS